MSSSKQPREAKAPIRSPNVKALELLHRVIGGHQTAGVLGGGIRPLLGLLEGQQSFHEGLWTWHHLAQMGQPGQRGSRSDTAVRSLRSLEFGKV